MPRALQPVVDFVPRRLQNLLRLGFRGSDQLFLLLLAFSLRPLVNAADIVLDLREARLDVGRKLVRLRAARASFFGLALNLHAALVERFLDRTAERPSEDAEEEEHVRELQDPAGDAEVRL